ncbi:MULTISPECIES: hypothetical protein, partial [unclassified Myroides]|uniref:hypothetical protein n=1 Tax=unclassified Myroides TaxID=2642485 RepID=UPI002578FDE5
PILYFVLEFDESPLRYDFHCVTIWFWSSMNISHLFYILFWSSMNLHCVTIFTALRFHHHTQQQSPNNNHPTTITQQQSPNNNHPTTINPSKNSSSSQLHKSIE